MLFQTLQFILLFFIPILIVNSFLSKVWIVNIPTRKLLLVAVSIVFYLVWNIPLFFLLASSISCNYILGRYIFESTAHKKHWFGHFDALGTFWVHYWPLWPHFLRYVLIICFAHHSYQDTLPTQFLGKSDIKWLIKPIKTAYFQLQLWSMSNASQM